MLIGDGLLSGLPPEACTGGGCAMQAMPANRAGEGPWGQVGWVEVWGGLEACGGVCPQEAGPGLEGVLGGGIATPPWDLGVG